ncbi:hypothetical protein DCS_07175 [Drechmeria coniospora]|uniref:VWFA domain-containing protein n=1 Tax=Drechmeria coniospora TaxID=98403 RepID=A0A151GDT4_DRECN|nr:hypothetical protein DCS_07175 [Drechmeria coniospora]KYK55213.1 hypothetical protein DCS_07175 [Drechmeria coniospora]
MPSDAAPPAYSAAPAASMYTPENMVRDDDAYYFLFLFDTIFLIDDSSSMLGPRWREVQAALQQITPVCTSHDDDGVDLYFMNHQSQNSSLSKASSGYYGLTDPAAVDDLFRAVRPCGPTPTRSRIEHILEPYFDILARAEDVQDVKPLNLIVITDGMPGPARSSGNPHLPEPAIVGYARRLDELGAPDYQVGIQFIQVGDDPLATLSLQELDDGLSQKHGVRDMVDTLKYGDGNYKTLTADEILKAVLGGVNKRLDNQRARSGVSTMR